MCTMIQLEYTKELTNTGLSEDQAVVYELLLKLGEQQASSLSKKIPSECSLSRPLVYKVLDELIEKELVEKNDPKNKVATFAPLHPFALRTLLDERQKNIEKSQNSLELSMNQLISRYTALSDEPGVRILGGLQGIDELYKDILNENTTIRLIRSPKDDHFPELYAKVLQQIKNQVRLRLGTYAITPFVDETHTEVTDTDKKNLITRRLVSMDTFNIPAQIIIYGDKVAITAFDNQLMTTIIQNAAISETFELMFEFIWNALRNEDAEIRKGLESGTLTPPQKRTPLPDLPLE